MIEEKSPLMVTILCITYNHKSYIRQCLEGFVMQKTNFRFEAIVHDDASTDGTVDIVREFAEKYPNIIKPMIEKENQYSKGKTSFGRTMLEHYPPGKYIAECEGDDYWTDPLKLQKQVDFMEAHPEYSMVCNRTGLYSQKKMKLTGENSCYKRSQPVETKDIILRGGLFISTCSILYRRAIGCAEYPDYMKNCHVGDYPLQIYAAMQGKVYYFNDMMSVYRVDNSTSWAGQRKTISLEKRISTVMSEVKMLKGFCHDYPQYESFFKNRIMNYINYNIPNRTRSVEEQKAYLEFFKDEIKQYPLFWKIDMFILKSRVKGVRRLYDNIRPFLGAY